MDGPGGDAATVAPPAAAGELSVRDAAASVLVALLLGFLLRRWVKRTPRVLARDTRRGHRWCHTGMFSQPSYCNVCESLLMTSRGAFCDACGVCACPTCVRPANKQLTCKAVTSRDATHKHHWIQGNLPFDSSCEVCDGSVGDSPELSGQRCCWCHRTVHDGCRRNISEVCDLGEFAQYVVPPTCVKVRATATVPRRLAISQVSRPATAAATTAVTAASATAAASTTAAASAGAAAAATAASSTTSSASTAAEKPWTPLIVLGNRKSGSTDAEQVLSAFRRYLNPAQVVDLGDQRPEDGLEWCHLVGPERCRVLVAGGDGTVDWVLNAIENLQLQPPPAVGILPLGTGNDLSRVLGSGEAYVEVDPERVLRRLQRADVINVDRWLVRLDPVRHVHLPGSEVRMTNYVSLGVDALVTLNFHKTRESPHYLWSSRLVNKLIYFCYGTKDVLERECHHLQEKLTLKMDGREVELPDIEALVVQNIATWGAGVRPWELGQGGGAAWVQRPDDGLLEVFCVYSSFHIAQMQVGLSEPLRLGQARNVEISLRAKVPMQLDGEPWEQGPCVIRVTHHNQARMLRMPVS